MWVFRFVHVVQPWFQILHKMALYSGLDTKRKNFEVSLATKQKYQACKHVFRSGGSKMIADLYIGSESNYSSMSPFKWLQIFHFTYMPLRWMMWNIFRIQSAFTWINHTDKYIQLMCVTLYILSYSDIPTFCMEGQPKMLHFGYNFRLWIYWFDRKVINKKIIGGQRDCWNGSLDTEKESEVDRREGGKMI